MSQKINDVEVVAHGLSLKMTGDGATQTLAITNVLTQNSLEMLAEVDKNYPQSLTSTALFQNFGLMHLLANSLPGNVRINFPLLPGMLEIIEGMYGVENRSSPIIVSDQTAWALGDFPALHDNFEVSDTKAVVAFSGGKDSLWNLWRMNKLVGKDNVLAVHIAGVNRSVAAQEEADTRLQHQKLQDFQRLRIVKLKNSSQVSGKAIMRSRDMFITALSTPLALEFGASKIVIEGDMAENDNGNYAFTELGWSWDLYNDTMINRLGIPVRVEWEDRSDTPCLADLIENWPSAVPMISNCFSPIFTRKGIRKRWLKETPNFMLENPSQCGACVKCRKTKLAMALAGNGRYPPEEVLHFLNDTKKWAERKQREMPDLLDQEFYLYLNKAIEMWEAKQTVIQ